MKLSFSKVCGLVGFGSLAGVAGAQGFGWSGCIDPKNTAPFSIPYGQEFVGTSLFESVMGIVGTVTYGDGSTTYPRYCSSNGISTSTANVRGRIGFSVGATGSVQSAVDDGMPLTFGYPNPGGAWSYECLTIDKDAGGNDVRSLIGANGFSTAFTGASDRYFFGTTTNNNIQIDIRVDVLGDTARVSWLLTNNDTATHNLGLWSGAWTAMKSANGTMSGFSGVPPVDDLNGTEKTAYYVVPGQTPPTTEKRYVRSLNPSTFPPYFDACFSQSDAYGLRVLNGPTAETEDSQGLNSDATQADELALGQAFFLLGGFAGGDLTFPDKMFGPNNTGGDVTYLDQPAYIQKFYESSVAPSGTRAIVQYFKSTWSAANYSRPYSVVLDAPNLMPADLTTSTGLATPTGGYTIRVYVDNTRGFSTADQSQPMSNVKVQISLPQGLNLASGDTAVKVIPTVTPGATSLAFVDYHVIPDGIAFGTLPYSVTVTPQPGPTKTIGGNIIVAATPKLTLAQGPNLVGTPFDFTDSSWEAILGLTAGTDFTAFNWDPIQNGYVISTSRQRGIATWIVANNNIGIRTLQSNPQQPADAATGQRNIQLQQGWNLIANPYNYAIPLGQLIGATNANSSTNFTWDSLVSQGFVNGAIAYYDTTTQSYAYLQSDADLLLPNQGYWIFVTVQQPLTLQYPPVFQEFLPGSTRSATAAWQQTSSQWRLQLAARTAKSIDDKNYIGVVATAADVTKLQIMKPPVLPQKVQGVSMAVAGTLNGKPTRLAQALSTSANKQQYTVSVTTPQDGDVTLTWPNIRTIPKTVQVRLIDTATGQTRVLNQSSGYTFTGKAGATRVFTVQIQPQTPGRATIGNLIVSSSSRAPGSPVTVSYTLGVASTTTIQITNGAGTPIFTVVSGRADQVGTNTVVWNLRDNANRQVAPGIYKVVVLAQSPDGTVARSVASVNVRR